MRYGGTGKLAVTSCRSASEHGLPLEFTSCSTWAVLPNPYFERPHAPRRSRPRCREVRCSAPTPNCVELVKNVESLPAVRAAAVPRARASLRHDLRRCTVGRHRSVAGGRGAATQARGEWTSGMLPSRVDRGESVKVMSLGTCSGNRDESWNELGPPCRAANQPRQLRRSIRGDVTLPRDGHEVTARASWRADAGREQGHARSTIKARGTRPRGVASSSR